jgi:hypothetical protein
VKIGTSYIPPVKLIFYAHNFGWLWMARFFGNTSPLSLLSLFFGGFSCPNR